MSSKTGAEEQAGNVGRRPQTAWSISARMILLYTLSSFCLLLLCIVFLYRVLRSNLEQDEKNVLSDRIRELRVIISGSPPGPELLEELTEDVMVTGAAVQVTRCHVMVVDSRGETLIETAAMHDLIPAGNFPVPAGASREPGNPVRWKSPDGKTYFLTAAWAASAPGGASPLLLRAALDVSPDEELAANVLRHMIFAMLVGVLLSAGAGAFTARQGMRPLHDITSAVKRVSATRLGDRLGEARWPRELVALAGSFDAMLARLEDSFTRLSRFSADLAHELRTPLGNIMGETEVTLSKERSADEYRQALESGLEELQRLSRIIDDLLFLARAEDPGAVVEKASFAAADEIATVRDFYSALAEEKGISLESIGDARVVADRGMFRRALGNLLSNAFQYTPRGGRIIISAKTEKDGAEAVTVEDTGCGIEPRHMPRLFDRFYRADPARSRHPGGTGLGLAIVKSIMDLNGGRVAVESEEGKGTKVTLRFPPAA
jgi:two-component system heavy metal sensor histidine kinase CusS